MCQVISRLTKWYVNKILRPKDMEYFVWEFYPGGLTPDRFVDALTESTVPGPDVILVENIQRQEFYVLTGFPKHTARIVEQLMLSYLAGVTRNYIISPKILVYGALLGSYRMMRNPDADVLNKRFSQFRKLIAETMSTEKAIQPPEQKYADA